MEGKELVLTEPLSFYGGLDPKTGKINDPAHAQFGESVSGKTIVMKRTRGSTSSPGTLLESLRLGTGPAAFILRQPDLTILVSVRLAAMLYDIDVDVTYDDS